MVADINLPQLIGGQLNRPSEGVITLTYELRVTTTAHLTLSIPVLTGIGGNPTSTRLTLQSYSIVVPVQEETCRDQ